MDPSDELDIADDFDFQSGHDSPVLESVHNEGYADESFTNVQFASQESAPESPAQESSTPQFEISVLDGEKKSGDFVSYTVHAKTTLEQYRDKNITVDRRYKDFLWLHDSLVAAYPAYIVAPLPEKSIFARYSTGLIEYRKRELERFLKRITFHRVLSTSKDLQIFFEATEDELASVRTQKPTQQTSTPAPSSGFGGWSFGSILKNVGLGAAVVEQDPWFTSQLAHLNELEDKLNKLHSASANRVKKMQELSSTQEHLAAASADVCATETDQNRSVADCFERLGSIATQLQVFNSDLASSESIAFDDGIKDYIRVIAEVKRILEHRTSKLGAYQQAERDLEARKADLQKQPEATQAVADAEKTLETSKVEFERDSAVVKEELKIFDAIMVREMKETLAQLAQVNMDYELKVTDLWKKFLLELRVDEL